MFTRTTLSDAKTLALLDYFAKFRYRFTTGMNLKYTTGVSEDKLEAQRIEQALSFSFSLNARLRNQTEIAQTEIDRLKIHIKSLEGHSSRVENHSLHLQNMNDVLIEKYEESLSWKLSAPVRWIARAVKRILR